MTKTTPPQCLAGTFIFGLTDHPADILCNAAVVTHFLAEVSLHIHNDGPDLGLSEDGAQGLYCILNAVENTIQAAIGRL